MKKHLVPTVACAALGIAGVAHADVLFFLDEVELFQATLEQAGNIIDGVEVFPWTAGPGGIIAICDPLNTNTKVPGWIEPGILLDNVQYQSNLYPFGAGGPNPTGCNGMRLFTTGFIGATSNGIAAGHFADSMDILSGVPVPANHTAMGLQVISFNNSPAGSSITVSVYDKNENLIGTAADISAPANQGGAFLGVIVSGGDTIGRINVYDVNAGFDAEGLFRITVYVSACPWDLNENGNVGVSDLLLLLASWGPCEGCPADFNFNGELDVFDLVYLLANWGPCP